MWASVYPLRNKSNENEIIDIVYNSKPKERLLLVEYLSKLQLGGLSIKNKQILINFCEEAIVSQIIKLEDKNIEEINKDSIATWYWKDKNEDGLVLWNAFSIDENRLIECARKNKYNYVGISDGIHCIDLKSKLLIFGESNSVKIKRNPPKDQSETDDTSTTTTTATEEGEPLNNDGDSGGIEISEAKWFWADDSKNGGHQDVWVEYNSELSRNLEIDFTTDANQQVRVDSERYVDTKRMLQVRYDSRWRVRMVKREAVSNGKSSSKSRQSDKPPTTSTFKKLYNLMSGLSISKNKTTPADNSTTEISQPRTFELNKIKLELPFILSTSQLQFIHYKFQSQPTLKPQTFDQSNLTKFILSTFKRTFLKNNNITYF